MKGKPKPKILITGINDKSRYLYSLFKYLRCIWALHESVLKRTEMRMVRWMCGTSLRQKKTNAEGYDEHRANWKCSDSRYCISNCRINADIVSRSSTLM